MRVTVKDGSLYEGILSHSSKTDGELGVCLKMARRKDDHESHKVYTELIVPPKELVMVTAARLEFAADKPVESVERAYPARSLSTFAI